MRLQPARQVTPANAGVQPAIGVDSGFRWNDEPPTTGGTDGVAMAEYDRPVDITERELAARVAEADRIRAVLRRCTLEWSALGDRILAERQSGSERPDDGRAPRR